MNLLYHIVIQNASHYIILPVDNSRGKKQYHINQESCQGCVDFTN